MTGCFEVFVHDLTAGAMKSHSKARSVVADRVSLGGDD
jgi:hypothetical protein